MTDPQRILESANTILLVDWANSGVPRALLGAGFSVFGYSPGRYSRAELVSKPPDTLTPHDISTFEVESDGGDLVFRKLDGRPDAVDIVSTYRPAKELPAIIAEHVLPLGARVLWLQPPETSAEARALAEENGITFLEGVDITEAIGSLHKR